MKNPILGIIGGGQLGSLLSVAANKIGIKTVILSDDENAPAKNFTEKFIYGKYDNKSITQEFIDSVDLVTYEFENIPFNILQSINNEKTVLPKPEINNLIQNRLTEKNFLNDINIQTTQYVSIKHIDELKENENFLPGLLKTTTLGYDGKGQYKLNSKKDISNEIDFSKEYILEKFINLKKEISVIITRFGNQKYEIYEPIENVHEDQILKHSKIPANISKEIIIKSTEWSKKVHNSGHLTINSHNISQFENHVRAVCGLEKIKTKKIYNAKMINLIGDDISKYRDKKFSENEFFFDYLKKDIKNKRKMGHITIIEK